MQVTTYKEAIAFINVARDYQSRANRKPSALTYAISKTLKRLEKHKEDYDELIAEAQAKYQKKDSDGVFEFHDDKRTQPKFTAENHAAFRREFKEIQATTFEFEPYIASSIPSDLEVAWYDYFVPFVIDDYPQ